MKEYHKIQTVFLRDPANKFKTLLEGEYSTPEFDYLKYNRWIFSEKVDGTNIRVICNGEQVFFEGKTDDSEIPGNLLKRLSEKFPLQLFQNVFQNVSVCLYGEGYGADIQRNKHRQYHSDYDFVLFDVRINELFLERKNVEDIAQKLKIDVVPIIGTGSLPDMVEKVKSGFKSQWGNFLAEGIVARPETELKTRDGKRIITKLKYKDFRRLYEKITVRYSPIS